MLDAILQRAGEDQSPACAAEEQPGVPSASTPSAFLHCSWFRILSDARPGLIVSMPICTTACPPTNAGKPLSGLPDFEYGAAPRDEMLPAEATEKARRKAPLNQDDR
jgi:hypothetical protein